MGLDKNVFDVLSVGHLTIDTISLPDRPNPFVVLGGSVAYVSLVARHLGARAAIASKVGYDFPEAYKWWLDQEGINQSNVVKDAQSHTTRFELKYTNLFERTLRSDCRAHPITIQDLSNIPKTEIVHVGPVANEIGFDELEELKKRTNAVSLDPQGLVRSFDDEGRISIQSMTDKRILELVDIFKCSHVEVQAVTGLSDMNQAIKLIHDGGARIVIVTLGAKGSIVSIDGAIHSVPACKPDKIVDPTGAGDAFIGGFLAEYARGEDASWCSCVGSAAASFVVEGVGPTRVGSCDEIYQRARNMCERKI